MDVAVVLGSTALLAGDVGSIWEKLRLVVRWLSLFLLAAGLLSLLYRYGPDRRRARWRWVTPGSAIVALASLLGSSLVTVYLARFAQYERTYGGLGSVLGLTVWLWLSMIVVLVGAELNWAIECKTSTVTDVSGRDATSV